MADILTQYGPNDISTITRGLGGSSFRPRGGGGFSMPDMSGLINLRIQMQQEQRDNEQRRLAMAERAAREASRIEAQKMAMAKEQMKKDQFAKDVARQDAIRAQRQQRADANQAAQLVTRRTQGGFNMDSYVEPDQDSMNLNRLRYAAQQGKDLNSSLASTQVAMGDIQGTEKDRIAIEMEKARQRQQRGDSVQPVPFTWSQRADMGGWGQGF